MTASVASSAAQAIGRAILVAAPWLMKFLSVAGTIAMFLVGGGILTHGVPLLHHTIDSMLAGAGSALQLALPLVADLVTGVVAGAIVLAAVTLLGRLRGTPAAA